MLGEFGRGDDGLGQGHVVVGQEVETKVLVGLGVVVDDVSNRRHKRDDALGHVVGGGGLAADDYDTGRRFLALFRSHILELLVLPDDGEQVQMLALVFVDALDLDVEEGIQIDVIAVQLLDDRSQLGFVLLLDGRPLLMKRLVVRELLKLADLGRLVDPGIGSKSLSDERRQIRIAVGQPPTGGDPIRLVLELGREELVKVVEDVVLDDVGVDGGDAVDLGATNHCQVSHIDKHLVLVPGVRVDDGHGLDLLLHLRRRHLGRVLGTHEAAPAIVDGLDDLHVARKHFGHHLDRPLLQGLRHDGVVGIIQALLGDHPSLLPFQALHVRQETEQFGHSDSGVSVVQLEDGLLRQEGKVLAVSGLEAGQNILDGGAHEEELLLEAELLAFRGGVIGIEDGADGLSALALEKSLVVVAGIEGLEVEFGKWDGIPKTEIASRGSGSGTGDGIVVRNGLDLLGGNPHRLLLAIHNAGLDLATEANGVLDVGTANLPRVAVGKPNIGDLDLLALGVKDLLEHSVTVTDTVAPSREIKVSHRVKEASGQTTKATVTKTSVALLISNSLSSVTKLTKSVSNRTLKAKVVDSIGQSPTHQELSRKVINKLGVLLLPVLMGLVKRINEVFTDSPCSSLVGILGSSHGVFTDNVLELVIQRLGKRSDTGSGSSTGSLNLG
mmetsp:Transcript_25034/g.45315  ORF Transcript_25034/g.45315 Transcript_25034/m.45315 type:complete len:668 (-) Transcript_25034:335-2338(-)